MKTTDAPTRCDECGKETAGLFPSAGQNLCRECFDAAQADAEIVAVGQDVTSTYKRK